MNTDRLLIDEWLKTYWHLILVNNVTLVSTDFNVTCVVDPEIGAYILDNGIQITLNEMNDDQLLYFVNRLLTFQKFINILIENEGNNKI